MGSADWQLRRASPADYTRTFHHSGKEGFIISPVAHQARTPSPPVEFGACPQKYPSQLKDKSMTSNPFPLPPNLPQPVDDGAAAHLEGTLLPDLLLPATDDTSVHLRELRGRWVIYIYPMTGRPGIPLPDGWDGIPGARGCTPQSCSFRDHYSELKELRTDVIGLSSQSSDYQREARDRLHLPFQLVSDQTLQLKHALGLPTFSVDGMELFKRITLIVLDGRITKVFYPVFPPDRSADEVLTWLRVEGA